MFKTFASAFTVAAIVTAAGLVAAAEMASVDLQNQAGESVGSVALTQTPHGTLVHATLTNLPAGTHAFHVHGIGKCEPPFKSAGGHFNPAGAKHGILSPDGLHAGDMPNVHVPETGSLEIEVLAAGVSLNDDLFDADGAAIVMHEGADDYMSDPAGAAGPRIACGVITK